MQQVFSDEPLLEGTVSIELNAIHALDSVHTTQCRNGPQGNRHSARLPFAS
jgi:hypothetical protein